jgi:4-hydroxythreonine-4-phosphate dehydrogenase
VLVKKLIIAVTMGDPTGIGPEIVLKSAAHLGGTVRGASVVIGDYSVLEEVNRRLGLKVSLVKVESPTDAADAGDALPVLDPGVVQDVTSLKVGRVSSLGGRAAVAYIQRAVNLALGNEVQGIATGPINKEALREAQFHYLGHTEMLSELSGSGKSVTMFMIDRMRIFFHTRHLSLRMMLETLSREGVVQSIMQAHQCLESVGLGKGRLALAALNPHASDGGLFGDEEGTILIPACEEARRRGVDVEGPVPGDSVFHLALQGRYDAVISLYHDQGHIAAKTYDFHRTVSVTFGLPFIRTSVDHGTAFDIAWKGVANPVSMQEAVKACFELATKYRQVSR